jgi:ATP-dependent Clp protease adaptor protein ClpS
VVPRLAALPALCLCNDGAETAGPARRPGPWRRIWAAPASRQQIEWQGHLFPRPRLPISSAFKVLACGLAIRSGGMSDNDKRGGTGPNTGVVVRARPKTRKPAMYKVLMLNDDYTPMEFVVHVLERFFQKTREEATRIMLHVHRRGVGVCGVYTYEVAETKVTQVMDLARQNQHPLQCTIEKE